MLGGADPVGVDRLRRASGRPRRASAAGTSRRQSRPARRRRPAPVGVPVGDAGRPGDDRHHLRREPAEILARLLVGDLVQLAELPLAGEPRRLRLEVGGRVAGQAAGSYGSGSGIAELEVVVDEQAPDLLVREPGRRAPRCRRRGSGARRPRGPARRSRVSKATTPSSPGLKSFIGGKSTWTPRTRSPVESRAVAHEVTLIPGDGTGPELTEATRRVLEATGVEFDWDVQEAGADVMDAARRQPAARSTCSTRSAHRGRAQGPDHDARRRRLPLGQRRRCARTLDLYAQVRPCKSYPGVRSRYEDVDLIIVRENTEDLYAGIEYEEGHARRRASWSTWIEAHGGTLPARLRDLDQADLGRRHAPDRRVRLRLRAPQRPPQGDGRPQGEHHEVLRRPLPARRARGRRGERRHRVRGPDRGQHVHAARPAAGGVRRARAAEPLRRHRLRPRAPG